MSTILYRESNDYFVIADVFNQQWNEQLPSY